MGIVDEVGPEVSLECLSTCQQVFQVFLSAMFAPRLLLFGNCRDSRKMLMLDSSSWGLLVSHALILLISVISQELCAQQSLPPSLFVLPVLLIFCDSYCESW
jgi:hypothetical protein